jgi:hypothetical protein
MRLTILFISSLIFSLTLSCGHNSKGDKSQFQSFVKKLNKIETPISFNSNYDYQMKVQYLNDNQSFDNIQKDPFYEKIQNEYSGFGIIGVLFETKAFVAILGNIPTDTGTPLILTFDKRGNKIDAHSVYENVMGDMGIYISNFESILPDMKIMFVDSTITRKINEDGSDEVPGTDSLSVKIKKYKIDSTGKFIRTE